MCTRAPTHSLQPQAHHLSFVIPTLPVKLMTLETSYQRSPWSSWQRCQHVHLVTDDILRRRKDFAIFRTDGILKLDISQHMLQHPHWPWMFEFKEEIITESLNTCWTHWIPRFDNERYSELIPHRKFWIALRTQEFYYSHYIIILFSFLEQCLECLNWFIIPNAN